MKTQTIYGLINDCGDGSSSMIWFRTQEQVDKMLDEDTGNKTFWAANEGCPSETLTFPADLDLEECGFYFYDMSDED